MLTLLAQPAEKSYHKVSKDCMIGMRSRTWNTHLVDRQKIVCCCCDGWILELVEASDGR
jgi:hypothetical protein